MAFAPRLASAVTLVAALFASAGCKSTPTVYPGIACDGNPCCGGPEGINCAENPDAACIEPGDACSAFAYGCKFGQPYTDLTKPAACTSSPFDDAALILVDDASLPADDASGPAPDATVDGGGAATADAGPGADGGAD